MSDKTRYQGHTGAVIPLFELETVRDLRAQLARARIRKALSAAMALKLDEKP